MVAREIQKLHNIYINTVFTFHSVGSIRKEINDEGEGMRRGKDRCRGEEARAS